MGFLRHACLCQLRIVVRNHVYHLQDRHRVLIMKYKVGARYDRKILQKADSDKPFIEENGRRYNIFKVASLDAFNTF